MSQSPGRALPAIEPMPPIADAALPWDRELADPVAEVARARADHGDTFVIDGPSRRTLFLFSPAGVRSFYELPEDRASKGIADWQMLRRKLPDELFVGRRTVVHELFGSDDVTGYADRLDAAVDVSLDELGDAGTLDVFAFTRRLGHRLSLACWGGERPSTDPRFDDLVAALDVLDGSAAFVHPAVMAEVAASAKRDERAALARVEELIAPSVRAHDRSLEARDGRAGAAPDEAAAPDEHDLFGRIVERWDDEPEPERSVGIARDVALVHLGSMSNLFAATGWMIAHLATHPAVAARVRDREPGLAERAAMESTRLGQRSIMLRSVSRPAVVRDERRSYTMEPGIQVATLLPLTNTTAMDGLATYDPDRWQRRRLRLEHRLPARELVTTFGHGTHSCPAQRFSLMAMTRAAERLLDRFELEPHFERVTPLASQIGGVARSEYPCLLTYRRRS